MPSYTWLASRHRPRDEGERLASTIDLVEHAVVVVLGFGLGWHVRSLAERMGRTGIIIVLEPDIALLRSVFEHIDHTETLRASNVIFLTDAGDRAALAAKLKGSESILAQGVAFLEHPASRRRLGEASAAFSKLFADFVTVAKTTLMTTLMRSIDTVSNLLHNLDHYALGPTATELEGVAAGFPAVIVSAGPSLQRNLHLLAQPGVRDRCVIIAVQTTLKPLLRVGIKPHFVTALDYHEISRRFYEGLTDADVEGVTLVADPKAHPAILDAFPEPGIVRCCAADFLDRLLGPLARPMGTLPAGATVAHLAMYLAQHLGCNPIAMIGQDLGFTDGLYYAQSPGTAIHDVWAPELNPFNTIAMMEWQRIVRHRQHLHERVDVHGRAIYTDTQMLAYLQQFERDFAACAKNGTSIIDATEGGVAKQHTIAMPLREMLDQYCCNELPALPSASANTDRARAEQVADRVRTVRGSIDELRRISKQTVRTIENMLANQHDAATMDRQFRRIDRARKQVEERFEAFEILNHLNQLGVFRRFKADRRLHMQRDLSQMERQRAQLDRDLQNVAWIVDAAEELSRQLVDAELIVRGDAIQDASQRSARTCPEGQGGGPRESFPAALTASKARTSNKVAAIIAIGANGRGGEVRNRSVLEVTINRLRQVRELDAIIILSAEDVEIGELAHGSPPVTNERMNVSPFGPEHEAIMAARAFSPTCWRGGIAGLSIYDEVLCPAAMHDAMEKHDIDAALIIGHDWPFIDVSAKTGCDAVIARWREHPDIHNLVFTQHPPGMCGCVISRSLMGDLTRRSRLSTIGALLVYQPQSPQGDPIARDACVQIQPEVRNALIRATADEQSPELIVNMDGAMDAVKLAHHLAQFQEENVPTLPQHLIIELTTMRTSTGVFAQLPGGPIARSNLELANFESITQDLNLRSNMVVTFDGVGDPLLHPQFDSFIRVAKDVGVRAVHLRTELLADRPALDRLLASGVDVISVDLHADSAETYRTMMGCDRYAEVLSNLEFLLQQRKTLSGPAGPGGICVPWIVPRLQRRAETYADINSFFDRWQGILGAAVIEEPLGQNSLAPAPDPASVMHRALLTRMTILSDGSVPLSELDLNGSNAIGNINQTSLTELWKRLYAARCELIRTLPADAQQLRTFRP